MKKTDVLFCFALVHAMGMILLNLKILHGIYEVGRVEVTEPNRQVLIGEIIAFCLILGLDAWLFVQVLRRIF